MNNRSTGALGLFAEEYAARYLKTKGYRIIGHNYRKPWGEIDIISQKEGTIVFVEVKANKKDVAGFEPERRVSHDKRYRMARIARTFLLDHHFPDDQPWQLDVIGVVIDRSEKVAKIRHYKNID